MGFFPLPFYFPISSCLYQVSSAASQCFSPSGFPSCLSTEPGPCYQAGMEKGHLCSEMEKKTRGTTSRKPSSTPPQQKFNRRDVWPKVRGKPRFSIAIKDQLPMGHACLLHCKWSGGKKPHRKSSFFSSFPALKGEEKEQKNCSGFFSYFPLFLSEHFQS